MKSGERIRQSLATTTDHRSVACSLTSVARSDTAFSTFTPPVKRSHFVRRFAEANNWWKMQILWMILGFILIMQSAFALTCNDCAYGCDNKTISGNMYVLTYPTTNTSVGLTMQFMNFTAGTGQTRTSFLIYNPNNFDATVYVRYSLDKATIESPQATVVVKAGDYTKVSHLCYDGSNFFDCMILETNIYHHVTKPYLLYAKNISTEINETICDKPCQTDTDCNFKKCNMAGFCGDFIACNERQIMCGEECIYPLSKKSGLAYECVEECAGGDGKDGICMGLDGRACEKNSDCTTGICNTAGMCGEKIVCPRNTSLCNGMCNAIGAVAVGLSCGCDFECSKGNICSENACTPLLESKKFLTGFWIGVGMILFTVLIVAYARRREKGPDDEMKVEGLDAVMKDIDKDLKDIREKK